MYSVEKGGTGDSMALVVRNRRIREGCGEVLAQAKAVLMDRHGMTEEQAHRFLQKKSMDSGSRLVQTALLVLKTPDGCREMNTGPARA